MIRRSIGTNQRSFGLQPSTVWNENTVEVTDSARRLFCPINPNTTWPLVDMQPFSLNSFAYHVSSTLICWNYRRVERWYIDVVLMWVTLDGLCTPWQFLNTCNCRAFLILTSQYLHYNLSRIFCKRSGSNSFDYIILFCGGEGERLRPMSFACNGDQWA